jgi:hypothetical protein
MKSFFLSILLIFRRNTPLFAEGMKGICINSAIDQPTWPNLNAAAPRMPLCLLRGAPPLFLTWVILGCYFSQDSAHHFCYFSTAKVLISG